MVDCMPMMTRDRCSMNQADQDWIDQLLNGDDQAAIDFWIRYGERLEQIAERRISAGLNQRVGADDIVQSVCRTFFRRAQSGQFEFQDPDGLWALLCTITLNKVRQHARYHNRQRRAINRDQSMSPPGDGPGLDLAVPEPSAEEISLFVDQLDQLLSGLDSEEQRIVDLKLQSFTNHEIAQRLDCSERTVRRMVKRVQSRMQTILHQDNEQG